jgi:hypothetical protein
MADSSIHPDGGPAFPTLCRHGQLTVWDFYALAVLHGLFSGPYEHLSPIIEGAEGTPEVLMGIAAGMADEAMRARDARQVR